MLSVYKQIIKHGFNETLPIIFAMQMKTQEQDGRYNQISLPNLCVRDKPVSSTITIIQAVCLSKPHTVPTCFGEEKEMNVIYSL